MLGRCRKCGGAMFLEADLGEFSVANCINCGNEEYLEGLADMAMANERSTAQKKAPRSGLHNHEFPNGCGMWSDCFKCPFEDCIVPVRRHKDASLVVAARGRHDN